MKVLMLNGSLKANGNTNAILEAVGKQLNQEGIDYEIFQMGNDAVRDCAGCGQCSDKGCVYDDDKVNEFVGKLKEADGLIVGTPVYYAHPSGRIMSFLDRVFCCGRKYVEHKPGAAVAVARRAGTTASVDALNKYFGIAQMPIVSSTYWDVVHSRVPGEAEQDGEGMQTMRNLARNMAWLLKCIEAGKAAGIGLPQAETDVKTNFIR